ncbi:MULTISPECIES: hypothetical protein [unclassified Paenarthrobacter]|uniref:hypothetical protein n=1 Tax=unclassified Paenarthrobacter TaxID=2634190 RepID=UPI003CEF1385
MPAQPASRVPDEAHQPPDEPLWCPQCNTDQHLLVGTIQQHYPPATTTLDVDYDCAACGNSYLRTATVQRVAMILNRPGSSHSVFQFGGQYLHCGAPMKTRSCELRRIQATAAVRPGSSAQLYEVHINTRVLGCSCGFRMEFPD